MADDRRVKHTKKRIKDAIVECLLKISLDKVTVKDICDTADINRSTFYVYYTDTFELYDIIEKEFVERLNQYLTTFDQSKMTYKKMLVEIISFIYREDQPCLALIKTNSQSFIEANISFLNSYEQTLFSGDELKRSYLKQYYIGGVFNVVSKWLMTNKQQSIEYIAELLYELTYTK